MTHQGPPEGLGSAVRSVSVAPTEMTLRWLLATVRVMRWNIASGIMWPWIDMNSIVLVCISNSISFIVLEYNWTVYPSLPVGVSCKELKTLVVASLLFVFHRGRYWKRLRLDSGYFLSETCIVRSARLSKWSCSTARSDSRGFGTKWHLGKAHPFRVVNEKLVIKWNRQFVVVANNQWW